MDLSFEIKFGSVPVGRFNAVRLRGNRRGESEGCNRYHVTIERGEGCRPLEFTVEHPVNDGVWALIRKSLEMVGETLGDY